MSPGCSRNIILTNRFRHRTPQAIRGRATIASPRGIWKALLDAYAGVWLFTKNQQSYSPTGPQPQTQNPMGSFESHLSYDLKPRLWRSLDGNFWIGGEASLNDVDNRQLASEFAYWRYRIDASQLAPDGKSV